MQAPHFLTLSNSELKIFLLDPVLDQARLGSRFCSGGYIYQIQDQRLGNLLSGPSFPADTPSTFDGQGMPEVFEIALGQNQVEVGEEVLVIGTGLVTRVSPVKPFHVRYNLGVKEHVEWKIENKKDAILFTAHQVFNDYQLTIERKIQLHDRTVSSMTFVKNEGKIELPIRWFAHPFFPLMPNGQFSYFDLEYEIVENPAFEVIDGWIHTRRNYDLGRSLTQALNITLGYPLKAKQRHPLLGEMHVDCEFPLAWVNIWANQHTFSFEPYFHTILKSNEQRAWAIHYHF